jgi:hypothetical protein
MVRNSKYSIGKKDKKTAQRLMTLRKTTFPT